MLLVAFFGLPFLCSCKEMAERNTLSPVEKSPTHHCSQGGKCEHLHTPRHAFSRALLTECVTALFQCDRPNFPHNDEEI
jgi:hypothetical protein